VSGQGLGIGQSWTSKLVCESLMHGNVMSLQYTALTCLSPTVRYVYEHKAWRILGKGPTMGVLGAGEWVRGKGLAIKSQQMLPWALETL